ncbi:hypothetical protein KR222_000626 [Zaprionus bogoriensis]|nr:hypothetical protein KR222_000626 [Zaprionus bogoriensis]
MSCICQYIVNSSPEMNEAQELENILLPGANEAAGDSVNMPENPIDPIKEAVTDDTKISVCVSELVNCRAENWLLKKKLHEHEVTIENLEQLMTTIMNKQHQILSEMFQLRKRNRELQVECNLQREYHSMERNALVKELHDVKTLARDRMANVHDNEQLGEEEEDSNQTTESMDCVDEDSFKRESDEEENDDEQASSPASTAASSSGTSPYSTDSSDTEDSEESEEEGDQEEFSAATESESD